MKYDFIKPEVYFEGDVDNNKPFKLFITPLPKGFGETLANPFRRVLLDFMPGTTVVGFKIPGVVHEMQEVPGASTDTIELIQSLKLVRFQVPEEEEGVLTVRLTSKKAGVLTAKDLVLPDGVKVLNPEQEIIRLNGNGSFEAEIYIQRKYGYKEAHEHEELQDRPDIIKIDSIFSPITQVGYEVKTARVGDEAKYDKIEFTVHSDGSIHPKEAVEMAVHLLVEFLGEFLNMSDVADKTKMYKEKKEERDRLMETPIELLKFSNRSYNALKKAGRNTVRDLAELDKKTLGAIDQLGKNSVAEILDVLESQGITLQE